MSISNYTHLILDFKIWHNQGVDYLTALVIFISFNILFKVFSKIIVSRLKKISRRTKTDLDDFIIHIVENIKPPFYLFISLYIAANFLTLSEIVRKILLGLFLIVIVIQTILALQKIIDFAVNKKILKPEEDNKDKETAVKWAVQTIKIILWVVGSLMVLSNFGVEVTSLIAGLGIGGIAIALALQNILGDIFASFSIFVDKPFKSGDFIIVGSDKGEVNKIGIKSTRLKTPEGQELIISNKELTESRINNYGKMEKRRASFALGIVYQTSIVKIKKVPQLVEDIIKSIPEAQFDRAHFKSYGDFSLNFEFVYYILDADYTKYMDIQQEINLKILDLFQKENIEFAYPTQLIYTVPNKD